MKRGLNKSVRLNTNLQYNRASPELMSDKFEASVSNSEEVSLIVDRENNTATQERNNSIVKLPTIKNKTIFSMNKDLMPSFISKNKQYSRIKLNTITEDNEHGLLFINNTNQKLEKLNENSILFSHSLQNLIHQIL